MARRADTRRELGVNIATIAGQSMPDFWTGVVLLIVFAVPAAGSPGVRLHLGGGLVLPASRSPSCRSR